MDKARRRKTTKRVGIAITVWVYLQAQRRRQQVRFDQHVSLQSRVPMTRVPSDFRVSKTAASSLGMPRRIPCTPAPRRPALTSSDLQWPCGKLLVPVRDAVTATKCMMLSLMPSAQKIGCRPCHSLLKGALRIIQHLASIGKPLQSGHNSPLVLQQSIAGALGQFVEQSMVDSQLHPNQRPHFLHPHLCADFNAERASTMLPVCSDVCSVLVITVLQSSEKRMA